MDFIVGIWPIFWSIVLIVGAVFAVFLLVLIYRILKKLDILLELKIKKSKSN